MCSAFFARVTYVRLLLIEQGTHRVERVFSSACRLSPIYADRTRHKPWVACFSSGGLCPIFAYRLTTAGGMRDISRVIEKANINWDCSSLLAS